MTIRARAALTALTLTILACQTSLPPTERIAADIAWLSADEREGRGVGTDGLEEAANYLARAFEAAGVDPGAPGYRQDFTIDPTAPAAAHSGLGGTPVTNVVGIHPGSGALAGEVVVVGAHYDHLGFGGPGSLDPDSTGVVHNGADDNASGTVGLLEVARALAHRSAPNVRTIVFVAFTAEELGLIGSTYYAAHPIRPRESTFAMVNMDMIGRLRGRRLAAFGAESAEEFPALLDSVNAGHGLEIASSGDGFGRSDHQSFFVQGIPVIHLFTGTHEEYHRTTDDAPTINVEGLSQVASFVTDLVWTLALRTAPLTFVEGEPPKEITSAAGERAYLGSIPDMTSSPGGVLLSGVRAGSPADEAGLQTGDILIGISEHEITDLYDMQNALNAFTPGDRVVLRIRREGEVLELPATLGRRGG